VNNIESPNRSINQSVNQFISRHSTEARATVRLCRIKEKCLKTELKCVNGWSSSTVQWKRVPKSLSSNRETTSSSVQVVRRNWQKLLCRWSQQARLTVRSQAILGSGCASAAKEPGHFEVGKSSSVFRARWLGSAAFWPTNRCTCASIYTHYRQGRARARARAVDLPARSFDLARPGVAPPLF